MRVGWSIDCRVFNRIGSHHISRSYWKDPKIKIAHVRIAAYSDLVIATGAHRVVFKSFQLIIIPNYFLLLSNLDFLMNLLVPMKKLLQKIHLTQRPCLITKSVISAILDHNLLLVEIQENNLLCNTNFIAQKAIACCVMVFLHLKFYSWAACLLLWPAELFHSGSVIFGSLYEGVEWKSLLNLNSLELRVM